MASPPNTSMPVFPARMGFWDRVWCVLGYHEWVTQFTGEEHPVPYHRLRDVCKRCRAPRPDQNHTGEFF